MILIWLIIVPFAAGVLAWIAGRWSRVCPRWIALAGIGVDLALAIALWARTNGAASAAAPWLVDLNIRWIDALGIRIHLALDGLSLLLILLTGLLGVIAVVASWHEIQDRVGFFHFHLLWVLAGMIGVFTALDLFIFYFFWEMMLVPMYFLIGIWGHERRVYAAVKFFIFTQISGLLMLIAIVALYVLHGRATGVYTFDYDALIGTPLSPAEAWWLMLGFFGAFAVKLPVVPVHTWLPDAHTEAPTAGSVVLASLLLKTGAYGLLRFVVPLFHATAAAFAPVAIALGVVGALYGAVIRLRPDRSQAAGCLHERQPHGFRPGWHICGHDAGASGRGPSNPLSRDQHGRAVRPGRRTAGSVAHTRSAAARGVVVGGAATRRYDALLRPRVDGAAGPRQLPRRVPCPRPVPGASAPRRRRSRRWR
jgi:NADH-quinone oxidoreductase subunit M